MMPLAVRVSKIQVMAEVTREGRPPEVFKLFLAERTDSQYRCERMGDMLNGSRSFLPVIDTHGGIVFLRCDSIRMVTISIPERDEEILAACEGEGDIMTAEVDVVFRDGQLVAGFISYRASMRIQDHLNAAGRFLLLENKDGISIAFLNTRHVLEVAPRRGG